MLRHLGFGLILHCQKLQYVLWDRWRYGSLLDGPIGEKVKVHFSVSEPGGPAGESLWAERVDRDCYKLSNNGAYVEVAEGDIVRAKVRWPYLEAIEVVECARRTWVLEFKTLRTDSERGAIAEALLWRGGKPEWWMEGILGVAVPLVDDPNHVCRDVLGPGVELLEY